MKKAFENLVGVIEYLRQEHPDLPKHVFVTLNDAKDEMLKCCRKKRCKKCDRVGHYDEVMGIWICEQCDKKPKYCPKCESLTCFEKDLGIWKCSECDWKGYQV